MPPGTRSVSRGRGAPSRAPPTSASLLHRRFDLPEGATVRPVQRATYEQAEHMALPGILVVEAPMGEGKTEAALLAAETLAARSGASGCLVALPTQATSDAMLDRVLPWLAHVPDATMDTEPGVGPRRAPRRAPPRGLSRARQGRPQPDLPRPPLSGPAR